MKSLQKGLFNRFFFSRVLLLQKATGKKRTCRVYHPGGICSMIQILLCESRLVYMHKGSASSQHAQTVHQFSTEFYKLLPIPNHHRHQDPNAKHLNTKTVVKRSPQMEDLPSTVALVVGSELVELAAGPATVDKKSYSKNGPKWAM